MNGIIRAAETGCFGDAPHTIAPLRTSASFPARATIARFGNRRPPGTVNLPTGGRLRTRRKIRRAQPVIPATVAYEVPMRLPLLFTGLLLATGLSAATPE